LLNPGKVVGDDSASTSPSWRKLPAHVAPPPAEPIPGPLGAPGGPTSSSEWYVPAPAAAIAEVSDVRDVPLPVLGPALRWPERGLLDHASACNGCGVCRSQEPTLRMCPTFRALHAEAAAP